MSKEIAWWLNQVGILVEIAGAGYLVFCAWRSRQKTKGMETHLDGIEDTVRGLISELRGNFQTQLKGFFVLAVGIFLQFLSNSSGS